MKWYRDKGINLHEETCSIAFDATALLPYVGTSPDGSLHGMLDFEQFEGPKTPGEVKAFFDSCTDKDIAHQVMAFVLVVTSRLNAPPYVLAAHEHRSCDAMKVRKWETDAARYAHLAGIMHFTGLMSDGDAGPRKCSVQHYTGSSVPAFAIGLERDQRFTTYFGVYDNTRPVGEPQSCIIFHSDITHIVKKARNQLLNLAHRCLVIGDYHVNLGHVSEYYLISKEQNLPVKIPKAAVNVCDK